MGLVSTLLGIVGFGIGTVIGLVIGYFFYIYFHATTDVEEPIVRPLHELDTEALRSVLPEIPLWVKSPDYDRVDWLNQYILDMWPYLDKAVCNMIRSMMKPVFDQYIGRYLIQSINFDHLTLGSFPPTIHGVKVYDIQEKEVVIEPAIKWAGNPNITVGIKILSWKVTVQLLDLYISLTPRVTLKPLVPSFPCFANLSISLVEKPQVDFGLKVLGGDIMAIPGLYWFIQETISTQVSNLYHWPNHLEIPILDASIGATNKPVGILHVNVVRALNLRKMDILGKSDPYVKLRLSGEKLPSKKTSIKMSNLNPEWNEQFKLLVKDPETQVLELHLYDWEKLKMHDKLGMQVVPLHLLTPHETKEFTLNLLKNLNPNDPHNKRDRGKIIVQLTFDPLKEEIGSLSGTLDGKLSGIGKPLDNKLTDGGVLSVTIEAAEDVEGKHHNNTYAKILFRGEKKKTKVIKRSREPRWNEEFEFMLDDAPVNDVIHIEVLSKGSLFSFHRKEHLGLVDINLSDVVNNGRINEQYHLIDSRNGVIHIEMKWSTV